MALSNKPLNPDAFKSYCVYQIYPASFCDSNGDGFGDLLGIKSKLGHIKSLGADVIWLSPIYKSPLKDMGYDISDYQDIDPRYGTLEDWDTLLREVHGMDMKLIIFGGSAWEWDERTQEYYLHLFVTEQPDLNWENPDVRQAVWGLMRWWMDRGCDGFRMDVINLISKVAGLPDAEVVYPDRDVQPAFKQYCNGPHVHEYLQEMYQEVLSKYPGYFTVGETPFTHEPEELLKYVLPERKELQMVFQFELVDLDIAVEYPDQPLIPRIPPLPEIKGVINKWQTYMFANGGWNSLYLENHDQARSISRLLGFGADSTKTKFSFDTYEEDLKNHWSTGAKLLAILATTQGGTVFIYQGEEIGSVNLPRSWSLEEYKDVCTLNFYREELERRKKSGVAQPGMTDVMDGISRKARDHARAPVQWDDSANAGFTSGIPWMRINDNYTSINVKTQDKDKDSVLAFWRTMVQLRKDYPVLIHGNFTLLAEDDEYIFAYTRRHSSSTALVIMNFSRESTTYTLPSAIAPMGSKMIAGNMPLGEGDEKLSNQVKLRAYEGQVWLLAEASE